MKPTAYFRFGSLRQETGSKHVRPGELVEAINVRQTNKGGVYAKRRGLTRTAMSYSGGSLSGTPESLLPGTGGGALMRDTGDQMWAQAGTSWAFKAKQPRPWPTVTTVMPADYSTPRPSVCVVGSNLWIFAIRSGDYEFSIVNAITGAIVQAPTRITAASIVNMAAAYDGTYVWLIWVDRSRVIRAHRFTAATPTVAPTSSTFYTGGVSEVFHGVDARFMSAANKVFVVASGSTEAATYAYVTCVHATVNAVTGVADSPVKSVEYFGLVNICCGIHAAILDEQDGSAATWYYATGGRGVSDAVINLWGVTASTMAVASSVDLATTTVNTSYAQGFAVCGYVDGASQVVYSQLWGQSASDSTGYRRPDELSISRHVRASGATTTTTVARGSWLASGTANYNGTRLFLTGYDDAAVPGATVPIQQGYHLRDQDGKILALLSTGEGCGLFHQEASTYSGTIPQAVPMPRLIAIGSVIVGVATVASASSSASSIAHVAVDMAKAYGKATQAMGRAFAPGPIPMVWSAAEVHEIAPIVFPSYLSVSGGSGTSYAQAAARYVFRDSDGTLWRSSPYVLASSDLYPGATLRIPTLRHILPGTVAAIEVYLGPAAGPKLQSTIANDSTVDSVTYTIPAAIVDGETLDTVGGALTQTWPVACQAIGYWRNRVFLAQGNRVWYSQELAAQMGTTFNEILVSQWPECHGDITAIEPVDWNYCGLFSAAAIAAISGAGPDGLGRGAYLVQSISTLQGIAAGSAGIQGPAGRYFQDAATGRLSVLTPGLAVQECGQAHYDQASNAVRCAVHHEAERMLLFFNASPRALSIDYQHPTDTSPAGQGYQWTGTAMACYAACVDGSGPLMADSTGNLRRAGTAFQDSVAAGVEDYRALIKMAPLQPADIQGEFEASRVQVLLSRVSDSTIRITTYPDYSTSGTAVTMAVSATQTQAVTRPPNCTRIQSLGVQIEEIASSAPHSAFEFEGIALEYSARGRAKGLNQGQVI